MIDRKEIRIIIKKYRKKQGMTQEQLAKTIQVHRTYICAIESGRRYPSWEILRQLIEVLEIDEGLIFRSVQGRENMFK